jgi:alkylation response protein AidB-like acyl-CoA dehydrogenase
MAGSGAERAASSAERAQARAELRAVARELLGKVRPPAAPDWGLLAASGWLGLEVPSELDGADATFAEVAVIAEELGRAAASGPYLGSTVLGVGTLRALAASAERDALLAAAAAGTQLPVAVLTGGTPSSSEGGAASSISCGADDVPFWLASDPGAAGGELRLHGQAAFAPDAAQASTLLMLARAAAGGEPVIVAVSPKAPGIAVQAQPVVDESRALALVSADAAAVDGASIWRFAGDPRAAARRLLDRAAVAVACDSLGLSAAMLDATVSYAKVREQFGRPIGSFQAVKHACANMLVKVRVAGELVSAAAAALADDASARAPGGGVDASVAAAMAKAYACETAVEVTGAAMQLHGGIGYTWESGLHRYLKRAALNRALFGAPAAHRASIAARYS